MRVGGGREAGGFGVMKMMVGGSMFCYLSDKPVALPTPDERQGTEVGKQGAYARVCWVSFQVCGLPVEILKPVNLQDVRQ